MTQNNYNSEQPDLLPGNLQIPSEIYKNLNDSYALIQVLTDHQNVLNIIRREMRGEELFVSDEGEPSWIQTDRPQFVVLDKNDEPKLIWNESRKKWDFVCHEEAIGKVISILKSCGLNQISPMTNINEEEIRADLLEIESKIAVLLCTKRKKWGIDKAEYPIEVGKLKKLVKDAIYRSKDGTALKAIRTITQRVEQSKDLSKMQQKQGGIYN